MRTTKAVPKQAGVALLMALIILLILTLLAVSSMQGSLVQERMASAQRDAMGSLEAAELALFEVEEAVRTGIWRPESNLNFIHDRGDAPDMFAAATWSRESTMSSEVDIGENFSARAFIEHLGEAVLDGDSDSLHVEDRSNPRLTANILRIVVMGRGPSGESRRFIESYYVYE